MASNKKMTLFIIGIALIIVAVAGGIWWYVIMHRVNPPLTPGQVKIGSATFTVEIASTTIEQSTGLSFRTALAPDHGMLFLFRSPAIQNFWMKDMNFPIDIIWISSGTVAGFEQNAEPQPGAALWSLKIYSSPDGTDKVLEVNAGAVAKYNIKVGDSVQIGPPQS